LSVYGRDMTTPRRARRRAPGLVHVSKATACHGRFLTDNLLLAGYDLPRGERAARVEEALSFFPEIAEKRHERGGALSGGQQQMLNGGAGAGAPATPVDARRTSAGPVAGAG